jgi:hypothetical protein
MPVADMLAHSPPLPLVIDYQDTDITAEDKEALILALAQRDRVRRIRFHISVLKLQKLIMAIDGEYPILEYLILQDPPEDKSTALTLPETLQIPHLRHLRVDCSIPMRSPLLRMPAGLVTLNLGLYHPSAYFQPTVLLQSLSLLPQLEMLLIFFCFAVSNHDVERQLMHTPIMTHVTLSNLRLFSFKAVGAYSEAVLSRITAPRLKTFQICYLKQVTFSILELLQFMERSGNFRACSAHFVTCGTPAKKKKSNIFENLWKSEHSGSNFANKKKCDRARVPHQKLAKIKMSQTRFYFRCRTRVTSCYSFVTG